MDKRAKLALLMIGFSWHSGRPRMGSKAAAARWGLGLEDDLPDDYVELIERRSADPTGIEGLEELLAESH